MFSQEVYEWGLRVIQAVQNPQSEVLTFFMKAVSFLSDPVAYTAVLPLVFLCVDEKCGIKLTLSVFFAAACNTALKNMLKVPRPYIAAPEVGLDSVHGYSTPSGHSQSSALFWPYAVYLFSRSAYRAEVQGGTAAAANAHLLCAKRRTAVRLGFAIGMPLAIGVSRVYLGVHYPSDVLLGWALGFLLSLGLILFGLHIETFISRCPKMLKILILALISAVLNALSPADTSMGAAFFGFGTGAVLLAETGGFCASYGTVPQKVLRLLVCAALCVPVYFILKAVLPGKESTYYQLFRFIRYAATGFSVSFAVPKLCILLKCAKSASFVRTEAVQKVADCGKEKTRGEKQR